MSDDLVSRLEDHGLFNKAERMALFKEAKEEIVRLRAALAATPVVVILSRENSDRLLSECGYEPAAPAVGGDYEHGYADGIEWATVHGAAQPASPLREVLEELSARFVTDPACGKTGYEQLRQEFSRRVDLAKHALSASPSEQAAPVTEDELTEIMDETWPDGHRAVAKKIIQRLSATAASDKQTLTEIEQHAQFVRSLEKAEREETSE
jgi:hypothetical protein